MPKIGETIHVTPAPGLRVLSAPGRFLPPEGAEVTWSVFLEERLRTGEITLPAPAEAEPAPAEAELAPAEAELLPGESAALPGEAKPVVDLVGHVTAEQAAALEGMGATLSPAKE